MAMWDGRFTTGPAEEMVRFSECIGIDLRMWPEDIEGSRAHARGLHKCGLLGADELQTLLPEDIDDNLSMLDEESPRIGF